MKFVRLRFQYKCKCSINGIYKLLGESPHLPLICCVPSKRAPLSWQRPFSSRKPFLATSFSCGRVTIRFLGLRPVLWSPFTLWGASLPAPFFSILYLPSPFLPDTFSSFSISFSFPPLREGELTNHSYVRHCAACQI